MLVEFVLDDKVVWSGENITALPYVSASVEPPGGVKCRVYSIDWLLFEEPTVGTGHDVGVVVTLIKDEVAEKK